jgi:hypothetical protein
MIYMHLLIRMAVDKLHILIIGYDPFYAALPYIPNHGG